MYPLLAGSKFCCICLLLDALNARAALALNWSILRAGTPSMLLGLGTRVRDQGRAPLGGRLVAVVGKSILRKASQPIPRLTRITRRTPTTIITTRMAPPPFDWLGGVLALLALTAAGTLVGLATGVWVATVGDTVAVAVGEADTVGDTDGGGVRLGVGAFVGTAVAVGAGGADVGVGDGGADVSVGDGVGVRHVGGGVGVVHRSRKVKGLFTLAYEGRMPGNAITIEIINSTSTSTPIRTRPTVMRARISCALAWRPERWRAA